MNVGEGIAIVAAVAVACGMYVWWLLHQKNKR